MSSTSSAIDAEQAKSIAIRACETDGTLRLVKHELEAYSKSKVGFLGSHQRLKITVEDEGSGETRTLNFFVKLVPRDSQAQVEFVKQRRVFNQEAEFFTKLMPRLLEATSASHTEAWAPRCYLANEDLVVLEDVRDRGYFMRDSKILSTEQLRSAAAAMARMHAASMIAERRLGQALNELYPQACAEQIFHPQIRDHGNALLESLIVEVSKRTNRSCKNTVPMIHRAFDFVTGHAKHRVVCHGDAWSNNVMIKDGQPAKCLLVDYQMTRYAPRMFDVAELICLSTYRDARDKNEKTVVKAYWEELCETLSKCEPSIDRPTYDELIDEYKQAKHSALFLAVMYLPSIMLSYDVFAKYKDDPAALYQNFVFRRNNACVLELMDQDEEYARRITEAVLDFVESCEKITAAEE
ncbi:uncharacterized protein LOC131671124 [Phymastichus coffea]|uniref:uncharacterized protein LOC131671124 n=1 Tax=Phymastichus coffea TaxID=108790 RepID=UPI00273C74B2|nr:uncharacterized protein LOC131671124 [Phymastichus coffea]